VDQGLIGRRPVGSIGRNINGALNWNVPWVEGLSLDLSYEGTSERVSNTANTLVIPPRYAAAFGGRYRLDLLGKPATFRAQLASFNNAYGFNNLGEGFYYNLPRRFQMSLTIDM
jgi:iron complex outermembrane receptor protein